MWILEVSGIPQVVGLRSRGVSGLFDGTGFFGPWPVPPPQKVTIVFGSSVLAVVPSVLQRVAKRGLLGPLLAGEETEPVMFGVGGKLPRSGSAPRRG